MIIFRNKTTFKHHIYSVSKSHQYTTVRIILLCILVLCIKPGLLYMENTCTTPQYYIIINYQFINKLKGKILPCITRKKSTKYSFFRKERGIECKNTMQHLYRTILVPVHVNSSAAAGLTVHVFFFLFSFKIQDNIPHNRGNYYSFIHSYETMLHVYTYICCSGLGKITNLFTLFQIRE